jgi:DNA polymerase-3 subunit chi
MTEVLFYHLDRQPLEKVLPQLIERSLERGWRVVVKAESDERVESLATLLWTYSEESFIPHGSRADGNPAEHPVWLTSDDDNANLANVAFCIGGASIDDIEGFLRVVILFSGGDDEAVSAAREKWKSARAAGHQVSYWQQDDLGRWQNRAAG